MELPRAFSPAARLPEYEGSEGMQERLNCMKRLKGNCTRENDRLVRWIYGLAVLDFRFLGSWPFPQGLMGICWFATPID